MIKIKIRHVVTQLPQKFTFIYLCFPSKVFSLPSLL